MNEQLLYRTIYRNALLETTKKFKSEKKKKNFYFECIEAAGYIRLENTQSLAEFTEYLPELYTDNYYVPDISGIPDIPDIPDMSKEYSHSNLVKQTDFKRTYITDNGDNRLSKLNTWYSSVDTMEAKLKETADIFDFILSQLRIENRNIKENSINMYYGLLKYFKDGNEYKLQAPRGEYNTAYIIMILYYSIHSYGINVTKEDISTRYPEDKGRLTKLPQVEKNLKKIFEDSYSFELAENIFGGLDNLLDNGTVAEVMIKYEEFKKVIPNPIKKALIAALVYYVTKEKGITTLKNGQKINQKLLIELYGNTFSDATLRRYLQKIK